MGELRWTAEQTAAILAEGNSLLVANAGTGKTTTVIGKILWLLGLEHGVDDADGRPLPPCAAPCELHEIAAITFTEKASADLKKKLREAIEGSARADELRWQLDRAMIGTIHGFCSSLLREHALRLGIDPSFEVLDAAAASTALDDLVREIVLGRLAGGDETVRSLLQTKPLDGAGFRSKGLAETLRAVVRDLRWRGEDYAEWTADSRARPRLDRGLLRTLAGSWNDDDEPTASTTEELIGLAHDLRHEWEGWLRRENARDFDGLVLDVRELLRSDAGAAALASMRRRFRILIVDEFQDTDFAQRDIAFEIGLESARPQLFLVGDPKQSIYGFRGADISVWNNVATTMCSGGSLLALSTNFRSAPAVVSFVNAAAGAAIQTTADDIGRVAPENRIDYAHLVSGLDKTDHSGVEWIVPTGEDAPEKKAAAARAVARRMSELVESRHAVTDPDTKLPRPCRWSDMAILYRARPGMEVYEEALSSAGIPYWQSGYSHLAGRQEVLDVLNVLRLLRNPRDDLRALGFLRSPFVCLRDEVITRIRLESPGRPLLVAVRDAVAAGVPTEWDPPDEHPSLPSIEHAALRRGIETFDTLRKLAPRLGVDELVQELLDRTGYPLHLMLSERPEEPLAALQGFQEFCETVRDLDLDRFLESWDRRDQEGVRIPQAPLYSKQDRVVTLSTVHGAKGLEWPIVFLVGIERKIWSDPSGEYWTDRHLGPVLFSKVAERGARGQVMTKRHQLETRAEEARLLYVASTRARDLLVIIGEREVEHSSVEWLEKGLAAGGVRVGAATADDPVPVSRKPLRPPDLELLDAIDFEEPDILAAPLPDAPLRFVHSATEEMIRQGEPDAWDLSYRHGVSPPSKFAPQSRGSDSEPAAPVLAPTVRGTLVHCVLEQIQHEEEISALLDEVLDDLGDPEATRVLVPGSEYRAALEDEIARVIRTDEWAWYVEGEHFRELPFVHFARPRSWYMGALDVYRPDEPHSWVIDFKTHPIDASEAREVADHYEIQSRIYRAAAGIRGPAKMRFHFTVPNATIDDD